MAVIHTCHCLCVHNHPDQPDICAGHATTDFRVTLPPNLYAVLGRSAIPACAPCAQAREAHQPTRIKDQ